ncbi:MAG: hypothetical protein R3C46_05810 [Hyphomonadaceae bacterium]
MFDRTDIRAAIEAGAISDEAAKRFEAFLKARNDPERMLDPENLRFLSNFNDVFLTIGIVVLMTGLGFLSAISVTNLLGLFRAHRIPQPRGGSGLRRQDPSGDYRLADPGQCRSMGCSRNTSADGVAVVASFNGALCRDRLGVRRIGGRRGESFSYRSRRHSRTVSTERRVAVEILSASAMPAGCGDSCCGRDLLALPPAVLAVPAGGRRGGPVLHGRRADRRNRTGRQRRSDARGRSGTLATAIMFMRDPTRSTRNSDHAFWLHLAAAPQIILGVRGLVLGSGFAPASMADATVMLAVLVAFAFLSLALNRRALIVSGLVTFATSLWVLVNELGGGGVNTLMLTALIIGGAIVPLAAAAGAPPAAPFCRYSRRTGRSAVSSRRNRRSEGRQTGGVIPDARGKRRSRTQGLQASRRWSPCPALRPGLLAGMTPEGYAHIALADVRMHG